MIVRRIARPCSVLHNGLMTERKPPGVSFESWTDRQIREAEARGEFAELPDAGRLTPIEEIVRGWRERR